MPKKVKYEKDDFLFIKNELEKIGYRQHGVGNFKLDFKRLGLVAPRPQKGREVRFDFYDRGLRATMWVTWDEIHQEFRESDLGWPLILQGDEVKYFGKPFRRTEGFIEQALRKAWIIRWRVKNRPTCPCHGCDAYMEIRERYKTAEAGKRVPTGQYYWGCFKTQSHPDYKPRFTGWDKIGPDKKLPEKAKGYVDAMRARVAAYKKHNKKIKYHPRPIRTIRNSWGITKPQNVIKVT